MPNLYVAALASFRSVAPAAEFERIFQSCDFAVCELRHRLMRAARVITDDPQSEGDVFSVLVASA